MNPYTETIAPEIISESVMNYAIQAEQLLIQENKKKNKKTTQLHFIPNGPHYYSWILQAAAYTFLNKIPDKKKIFLIFSQDQDPKSILIETNILWPHLWQTRKPNTKIFKKRKEKYPFIKYIKAKNELTNQVFEQLTFIRVITQTTEIVPIFIWPQVLLTQVYQFFLNKETRNNYHHIFVSNLSEWLPFEKAKHQDQILLSYILSQKSNSEIKKVFPLLHFFNKLSKKINHKPQALAYLNSSTLSWNSKETIGFTRITA